MDINSSSDDSVIYRISYEKVHLRRDDSIVWRWTCECRGYLQHRRSCKHIREAQKHYCGWQENRIYDPALRMDSLHDSTGEGKCPLCGRLAYPLGKLVNLHGDANV
jgi:hypothetical protein